MKPHTTPHHERWPLGIVAVCVVVLWAVSAGSASAVVPQLSLTVGLSPYTGGTAPATVTLTLHTSATPDPSDQPFSTRHMSFDLDPSVLTGFQPPAGCSGDQVISDATKCVSIGDGSMQLQVLGLTETMTLGAFQSTDPNALLLLADGRTPLRFHELLTMTKATSPTGGSRFDVDIPAGLQQPAHGAYSVLTDFQVALRSTIGLAGCPPSPLTFATHSDFIPAYTPGSFSADAATSALCQIAPPVAPPPFAPVPSFATRAARGHGRVLGKLLSLRSVRGMTDGSVTLTCTAGCSKRRLGTRTLRGTERAPLIRLHPALKVTRRTRVQVKMVNAAGAGRTARFRFMRRTSRLIAVAL